MVESHPFPVHREAGSIWATPGAALASMMTLRECLREQHRVQVPVQVIRRVAHRRVAL